MTVNTEHPSSSGSCSGSGSGSCSGQEHNIQAILRYVMQTVEIKLTSG